MALSSRELLLILRARDEASRVLRSLSGEFGNLDAAAMQAARSQMSAGAGLVSLGVGIGAVGVAALGWLKGSVDMAVEFEKGIALVATQTDKVKVSQQELGDIVKRTAHDIAVPIDQLSKGLYDIFSSMDVTVPQSEALLRSFAKEAVAGQVDLQTAARATIGILNAFHLTAEDVTRVQDVQFQLVRKGIGTYEQFSEVIGRATPSAARAGQSVETLAGMLAYLTRNGLSAAMAAASAGRAFDAISNPKTVSRLEAMGVTVKDAAGNFLPLTDVITDLQKHMSNLTAPERAAALADLFKGSGGTIQARRFFDAVLKDEESVKQFVGLVGDMNNATGAFGQAYDTMANTTASQSQILQNQWQTLRIEVGQALIPVLQQLMKWLSALLGWWNSLSDGTKKQIVIWVAIGAAILVVLGFVIAIAGAIMMLGGAAAALGIGLGALLGIFGLIVLAIAAIIVVAILVAKNWDAISSTMSAAWNAFWNVLKAVADWIWSIIGEKLTALWNRMSEDVVKALKTVSKWFNDVWHDILGWTQEVWPMVQQIVAPIAEWFGHIWGNVLEIIAIQLRTLADVFGGVWTIISGVLQGVWTIVSSVFMGIIHILEGIIQFIFAVFTLNWSQAWEGIKKIFQGIWEIIGGIVLGAWQIISAIVEGALQIIWALIKGAWDTVVQLFEIFFKTVSDLWNAFWSWVTDLVVGAWKGIVKGVKDGFEAVINFFRNLQMTVDLAIGNAAIWLYNKGKDIIVGAWNGIKDAWNNVVDWLANVQLWIGEKFRDAGTWLYEVGKKIIGGLWEGIKSGFGGIKDGLGWLGENIIRWKGPPEYDKVMLFQNGSFIMQSLLNGMQSQEGLIKSYLGGLTSSMPEFGLSPTSTQQSGGPVQQTFNITTQEIDPRRHAAELGFELYKGPIR